MLNSQGKTEEINARRLWIYVILSAIMDCNDSNPKIKRDAMSFLKGKKESLFDICYVLRIDPSFIIRKYKKLGHEQLLLNLLNYLGETHYDF